MYDISDAKNPIKVIAPEIPLRVLRREGDRFYSWDADERLVVRDLALNEIKSIDLPTFVNNSFTLTLSVVLSMRDLPGLSLGERVPRYFEALHKLSKAYIYPKRFLVQNGIAYIAGAEYGLLIFDLN